MKRLLKTLFWAAGVILLVVLGLYLTGNGHIINGLTKTYFVGKARPDIDDFDMSYVRKIPRGNPQPWPEWRGVGSLSIPQPLTDSLESFDSRAFLVVRHDTLIHEQYWEDYGMTTLSNSFSMAKSFTGLAIGAALDEGLIQDVKAPVGDFIPEFENGLNISLNVEHLLTMSSGIDFGESYSNPFGFMAKAYYGNNLPKLTLGYQVTREPGTMWVYEGGNTILLGLVLRKVTQQDVSSYFSKRIWQRIGAENDAYWGLDSEDGMEKMFSAFYSTPRDYLRLGQLILDSGRWNGNQVVSEEYISSMLIPVNLPGKTIEKADHYGRHWWIGEHNGKTFYSCRGMRGQYIIILPWLDAVVVRLGHEKSDVTINNCSSDVYFCIDAAISLIEQYEERH